MVAIVALEGSVLREPFVASSHPSWISAFFVVTSTVCFRCLVGKSGGVIDYDEGCWREGVSGGIDGGGGEHSGW